MSAKSIYASKDLLKIQTDFPGIDIRADKETVGGKKKQTKKPTHKNCPNNGIHDRIKEWLMND